MSNPDSDTKTHRPNASLFVKNILDWFAGHGRDLPWRYLSHQTANPYHVWLSEIMLQQTTVTAVRPYFERFTTLWPTVQDMAQDSQDNVMAAWAGLGYYSRARNLHKAACMICDEYDGAFPTAQKDLLTLPGVGDYTSAAIAAIAFKQPATVIDGNIERIISRIHRVSEPLPKAKKQLKSFAAPYYQQASEKAGDLAQALMDVGSSICTPKNPKCLLCPVQELCAAYQYGDAENYPVKPAKKAKPSKVGYVYIIQNDQGEYALERRPEKGLLGSTLGFLTSEWIEETPQHLDGLSDLAKTDLRINHVFTHFNLKLEIFTAKLDGQQYSNKLIWSWDEDLQALPSLFAKVYKAYRAQV